MSDPTMNGDTRPMRVVFEEALRDQRRYQFLRDSGWVYPPRVIETASSTITPGRIANGYVDECVDAAMATGATR